MEEQGATWGMRKEVCTRVVDALHEFLVALQLLGVTSPVKTRLRFDEIKLTAFLGVSGARPFRSRGGSHGGRSCERQGQCQRTLQVYAAPACRPRPRERKGRRLPRLPALRPLGRIRGALSNRRIAAQFFYLQDAFSCSP
jgi:hypothetical protein